MPKSIIKNINRNKTKINSDQLDSRGGQSHQTSKFLINSTRLQNEKECFKPINILHPDEIYGQLDYQAISKKNAY